MKSSVRSILDVGGTISRLVFTKSYIRRIITWQLLKKIVNLLVLIILALAISGCAVGNKGTMHYNRSTTVGQELIDLKEAKDKGAISQEEYDKAKQQILKCSGPIKVECSYSAKSVSSTD